MTRSLIQAESLNPAVREHFSEATDLRTFVAGARALTRKQRQVIVQQALILMEQNYAHLPMKRSMHAIDPVQRLKLLLETLEDASVAAPTEAEFHRELTNIFTSVRDLHTNYLLPEPLSQRVAFLPFMVEDYVENGKRKYIVSHIVQGFDLPLAFVPGVEVVYWNGMPIERAVLNNAERGSGSNKEARHARGVQTLTIRALRLDLPPDEEWVVVGYQVASGDLNELRIDWLVNPPPPSGVGSALKADPMVSMALGLDLEQDIIQRMRKALFAPRVVAAEMVAAEKISNGEEFGDLESSLPDVFEAKKVTNKEGTFGHLRIRTFSAPVEEFVNEFIRLVSNLPGNGLIIDVRGNGGGIIWNGELILQTLTPKLIQPEPAQFINTPLNLKICRKHADLSPWVDSIQQALRTSAMWSAGHPISDPGLCNSIGQRYFGPVVLITDALCYSTTDIFAAGFQDHGIGLILGTDGNTGAGGANVWTHDHLMDLASGTRAGYQPLPNGAGLRVAIRRTLRVGKRAGTPVEDLGVIPDERYFMTRNDLLNDNADLLDMATKLLAATGVARSLAVTVETTSPTQAKVVAIARGMNRLDVYLDDRPLQTLDIEVEETNFTITKSSSSVQSLSVLGFNEAELVARYRTSV